MRKVDRAKDAKGAWRFRLNNEFIFPIGTLDQGWWPDGLLTPPSLEACRPDVEVDISTEDILLGRDPQLDAAIRVLAEEAAAGEKRPPLKYLK